MVYDPFHRDWLPLLHNSKKHINPVRLREQKLKKIRKLLHKMPFERSGADIEEILEGLKLFPILTKQVGENKMVNMGLASTIDYTRRITVVSTVKVLVKGQAIPKVMTT